MRFQARVETQDKQEEARKKTITYVAGSLLGAAAGLLSAYLFSKESEARKKNLAEGEEPPEVPATAWLGLLVSAVTLIRQIAETGSRRRKK